MSDYTKTYHVIGDTYRKIDDACKVLIKTADGFRDPGTDSIASYRCKGPDNSVWLVMVGPFDAMCERATDTARELAAHINEQIQNKEEDNDD